MELFWPTLARRKRIYDGRLDQCDSGQMISTENSDETSFRRESEEDPQDAKEDPIKIDITVRQPQLIPMTDEKESSNQEDDTNQSNHKQDNLRIQLLYHQQMTKFTKIHLKKR